MGNGRVWVYNAQRPLAPQEQNAIKDKLQAFCAQWAAHGNSLSSHFNILHNQVLILKVDEDFEAATGCSIDSSVEVFRQIDAEYQLDLFNRMNLAFLISDRVKLIRMAELNTAYQAGLLKDDHIFLDHSVSNLNEMEERWNIPFAKSWAYKKVKDLV